MSQRPDPIAWRPALGLLALLVPLGVAGCGSTGQVTGKVTYQGQPLGSGIVAFHWADATRTSAIDADGHYTIQKAPLGPARITVETMPPPGGGGKKGPQQSTVTVDGAPAPPPGTYVAIPARYKSPEESGLTYTVVRGRQTHDIPLD
jgi:hypothetical protein